MSAKPWLTPDAQAGSYALGLLGLEERKLLYQLARYVYTGEGAVVELGAFCGASTRCLAAGLRDNPRAAGNRLHSYDCFIANEQYLVDFIWTQFDEAVEMGQSFAASFRRVTAEFVDLIEVHTGDLLEESWPSEKPIEILFVDVAKTLALSGIVLNEIVPHLIPEKSIVIHQDFYHPTAFYLPVVMDFLMDHFSIIEAGRDWSTAFRLETAIPQDKLRLFSLYKFSFAQQQAALRHMMRRVGMPGRDYLRISECAAVGTHFGEQRFRSALAAAIRIRNRLYGAPSLMPSPTAADKAYLMLLAISSAITDRIVPSSLRRNGVA